MLIFDPGKKSFDDPAPFVTAKFSTILCFRFLSVFIVRWNQFDSFAAQIIIQIVTVIRPVTYQHRGYRFDHGTIRMDQKDLSRLTHLPSQSESSEECLAWDTAVIGDALFYNWDTTEGASATALLFSTPTKWRWQHHVLAQASVLAILQQSILAGSDAWSFPSLRLKSLALAYFKHFHQIFDFEIGYSKKWQMLKTLSR